MKAMVACMIFLAASCAYGQGGTISGQKASSLSPAVAPGQPPPAGCGIPCEAEASLSLEVVYGWNYPLQGGEVSADYVLKNTSSRNLQGTVNVTLEGQLMHDANPQNLVLAPGATYSGQVWIDSTSSGNADMRAQFVAPLNCKGLVIRPGAPPLGRAHCTGGQVYATATATAKIEPDGDHDGLSDNYEHDLLQTYTPLMLFSKDHSQQEQYAPIDVIDFLRSSSLASHESDVPSLSSATLKQNPEVVLDPVPASTDPTVKDAGTINPNQTTPPPNPTSRLPRQIYVSPSSSAEHGTDWNTVLARRNVGLYGHVVLLNVSEIADPALSTELAGIFCPPNMTCTKSVLKVEYWQFFGYSHDFQDPLSIPGIGLPGFDNILADVIDHSGDWCTVQLYVDPDQSSPDKAILAIYHYAHGLQFGFDFQKSVARNPVLSSTGPVFATYAIEQLQGPNFGKSVSLPYSGGKSTTAYQNAQNNVVQLAKDSTSQLYVHPVVYVEWGGHEFWPTSAWSLDYASKHGGDGYNYVAATPPNIGEIGAPMPNVAQAVLVTGFSGFWGYYGPENHNKPPPGPPLHAQWLWYPGTPPALLQVRPTDLPF